MKEFYVKNTGTAVLVKERDFLQKETGKGVSELSDDGWHCVKFSSAQEAREWGKEYIKPLHQQKLNTVTETLDQRGERYGKFTDHARCAQSLQDVMREFHQADDPKPRWNNLSFVQKQALTVIADKIARILNGDPDYVGNWHDIQGYAKLVEDTLEQE